VRIFGAGTPKTGLFASIFLPPGGKKDFRCNPLRPRGFLLACMQKTGHWDALRVPVFQLPKPLHKPARENILSQTVSIVSINIK
jgi:hypothetical protein